MIEADETVAEQQMRGEARETAQIQEGQYRNASVAVNRNWYVLYNFVWLVTSMNVEGQKRRGL